jgi:uncharacterized lipoprotein NlpE involved in copper resistance
MKKAISALAVAFAVFGLSVFQQGCQQGPSKAVDAAHNARNSLNWDGVYAGTIPAASGPGINVQLTLHTDETYELRYEYVDKPDIFTAKGSFKWADTGDIIKLDARDLPPYYKVSENFLIQLDMQGELITGSLADHYILRKIQ